MLVMKQLQRYRYYDDVRRVILYQFIIHVIMQLAATVTVGKALKYRVIVVIVIERESYIRIYIFILS
jgi:hypothetical protein